MPSQITIIRKDGSNVSDGKIRFLRNTPGLGEQIEIAVDGLIIRGIVRSISHYSPKTSGIQAVDQVYATEE